MARGGEEKSRHPQLDIGIVVWLIVLSFWSGVSYMQIQSNKELIDKDVISRQRMWDTINMMRDDLSTIAGYIKGINERDEKR